MSLCDLEMWESQYHVVACFCSENGLPNNLELFVSNWLLTWDSETPPKNNFTSQIIVVIVIICVFVTTYYSH